MAALNLPPSPAEVMDIGDPKKEGDKSPPLSTQSDLATQFDVRDAMHYLVANGITSPSQSENAKAMYLVMMGQLGAPMAQKLFNHIAAFNQGNDIKGLTDTSSRLDRFYSNSSSDPEIKSTISKLGGLAGLYGKTGFGGSLGGVNENKSGQISMGAPAANYKPKIDLWKP